MWAALSLATLLTQLPGPHVTAWHYFHDAARLLLGTGPDGQAGGLHLYGDRPDLQFGPLSIAAAVPFSFFGQTVGSWLAMVAASAMGLLALALLLETVKLLRPELQRQVPAGALLVGGATVIVTWGDVAVRTAHIDDAIALLSVVSAARWCAKGRPWATTLALAVAAAAKPWAIIFVPLALLPLPLDRRGATRVVLAGGSAIATWAPFVLAEPRTIETTEFGISNDPTSVLRAFGITEATTPGWVRPAQLLGGMALVALLTLARRWPAAILAGVAWRLLLEPGANRYYTIGLVLGALLMELSLRDRIPWMTVLAAIVLEATATPWFPAIAGRVLRLLCVIAALAVAVGMRSLPASGDRPRPSPP